MIAQGVWLVAAAESIRHVDMGSMVKDALAYIARHPKDRYRSLGGDVRSVAAENSVPIPPNVTAEKAKDGAHVVFFARGEGPSPFVWKVNDRWLTEATFGSREMDFNWYSTWSGNDRIGGHQDRERRVRSGSSLRSKMAAIRVMRVPTASATLPSR